MKRSIKPDKESRDSENTMYDYNACHDHPNTYSIAFEMTELFLWGVPFPSWVTYEK